jgi:outer membrane protein assembly factor BamB
MHRVLLTTGVALSAALLAATNPVYAGAVHWGHGLSRNQVSEEANLPDRFEPESGLNVRWIAELGSEAHATPIAAAGRVFMGTNNERPRDPRHEGDRGVFKAFDERDGRFLWQLVVPKYSNDPYQDWPRAGISSTPTVEGDRVYVLSNRGEALCLDIHGMANGNSGPFATEAAQFAPRGTEPLPLLEADADLHWLFDIHAEVDSYPHDAAHASVLVLGNHLYINTGNGVDNTHRKIRKPNAPSLVVLDKRTGRLVAHDQERIGPRIFHCTWSSPAYGEPDGRSMVIFAGGDGVLYGFKPAAESAPSDPVAPLQKIWWFDCDPEAPKEEVHRYIGNRQVSPSNIKSMPVFHEDRIYVTVGGDLWWGKNEAWLQCIDARGDGDVTRTALHWRYPLVRHSMSTPAVHEGLVYAADCGRMLHCVDAATGEPVWTHDTGFEVWASPLVADGKVYIGNRRGDFHILAAGREKKLLHSVRLDSPISATATAARGTLYVATMQRLYALQTPRSPSKPRSGL